jgi:hypothetical protein
MTDMHDYSDAQLEAYLDEGLTSEQTARIEASLRAADALAEHLGKRLMTLAGRRDAGVHSLGAIWRQHRLSCPARQLLGSYLLGVLEPAQADYVRFHFKMIGCRACEASLTDLRQQQAATEKSETASRRQKYFQSSVGHLKKLSQP